MLRHGNPADSESIWYWAAISAQLVFVAEVGGPREAGGHDLRGERVVLGVDEGLVAGDLLDSKIQPAIPGAEAEVGGHRVSLRQSEHSSGVGPVAAVPHGQAPGRRMW